MNLFEIPHIIIKSLKGQSTDSENKALVRWLSKANEHQDLLNDLRNEEHVNRDLVHFNKYNTEKAWALFKQNNGLNKKAKRISLPLLRVVAIFVLVFTVGGVIYFINSDLSSRHSTFNTNLEPGEFNAILHVGEQEVALNDSVSTKVGRDGELAAKVENGQITYEDGLKTSHKMTVVVPNKCEYQFVLSDGTKVWMNAGSKLSFNHPFSSELREIDVEGEIYLEVTKDIDRPFVVKLPGKNSIQVLGTEFNVKAYPSEYHYQAVLVEGSILWKTNSGSERIMEPGQLLLADLNNIIEVKDVEVFPYIAWRNGRFVFEGERLEVIMTSLARWYGVKVTYEDEVIKDLHFSIDIRRYDNLNDIIKMLELTGKIYFRINGSEIIISKHK